MFRQPTRVATERSCFGISKCDASPGDGFETRLIRTNDRRVRNRLFTMRLELTVEKPERPRWTPRLTIYAVASARSSNSAYASRTSSRMRSWAVVSTIGRRSAKLRRSPLTVY